MAVKARTVQPRTGVVSWATAVIVRNGKLRSGSHWQSCQCTACCRHVGYVNAKRIALGRRDKQIPLYLKGSRIQKRLPIFIRSNYDD